jgi:hypothetical protein
LLLGGSRVGSGRCPDGETFKDESSGGSLCGKKGRKRCQGEGSSNDRIVTELQKDVPHISRSRRTWRIASAAFLAIALPVLVTIAGNKDG